MDTDLPCDPDLAAQPLPHIIPAGLDLLELARWGALLVSAALAAHQRPGDLTAQARLLNVAAVLERRLQRMCPLVQ